MDSDWFFRTDEYICDLRTVGVLIRNGKLLVQRDRDGSEYVCIIMVYTLTNL